MNLKVLMFPQLRETVPTLEARSGWCLQAAARRRQVTCSVPDVRFLWHHSRGHGHCGTSIATFRSEPLLTAMVAQPSDLQQRPVVQLTGKRARVGQAAGAQGRDRVRVAVQRLRLL